MENPNITVADIASMISIIEAATTRGALKPDELVAVGQLYNRLKVFLDFVNKQLEQQAQGEANA